MMWACNRTALSTGTAAHFGPNKSVTMVIAAPRSPSEPRLRASATFSSNATAGSSRSSRSMRVRACCSRSKGCCGSARASFAIGSLEQTEHEALHLFGPHGLAPRVRCCALLSDHGLLGAQVLLRRHRGGLLGSRRGRICNRTLGARGRGLTLGVALGQDCLLVGAHSQVALRVCATGLIHRDSGASQQRAGHGCGGASLKPVAAQELARPVGTRVGLRCHGLVAQVAQQVGASSATPT